MTVHTGPNKISHLYNYTQTTLKHFTLIILYQSRLRNCWRHNNNSSNNNNNGSNNNDIIMDVFDPGQTQQQDDELNEEEVRMREEEEKREDRIRKGLWPSSEWTEDESNYRNEIDNANSNENIMDNNNNINNNHEEVRRKEEEKRWEEKENERIRKGLWPSSEWTEDEEEGAVGYDPSYYNNSNNNSNNNNNKNNYNNNSPATIEVDVHYMEPIPSHPPPKAPKKLRRRPSSIPRTARVEIENDLSRVNFGFAARSTSENNISLSDDSENEVFSTCFHSYASIHNKID